MNQTRLELLVGSFVLLGIVAIIYLAIKLGSGALMGGDTTVLVARFANAGGLNNGSSVLMAGVAVGRVEKVEIDPEDYSAIATMRVRTALRLPTDTMASIKTTGLIGDKYVALAPGADETYLEAGDRITMTESSVDLEGLISKMAFGGVETDAASAEPTGNDTLSNP
jgi:phospholipid/cholesterol/gamma-HCH transport system substrate-binding protein